MHPRPGGAEGDDEDAGFGHVDVHNPAAGVVARLHWGLKC